MPLKKVSGDFVRKNIANIEGLRSVVAEIALAASMPLPEFRRIVRTVQQGEREASPRQEGNEVEANLRPVHFHRQEIHQLAASSSSTLSRKEISA